MAIEKAGLGTENDPDILPMGNEIEVFAEPSRQDQIREAAEILVADDQILLDEEIDAPPEQVQTAFDANLVEELDPIELSRMANDVLASIHADKESRSEWEETYVDGLKYLGMHFAQQSVSGLVWRDSSDSCGGRDAISSPSLQGIAPGKRPSKN